MDTLPALPTWGVVSFDVFRHTIPTRSTDRSPNPPTGDLGVEVVRFCHHPFSVSWQSLDLATGAERADQPRLLASRTTSRRPPGLLARLAKSSRYGNQGRSPSRFGARSDGRVEPPATPRTARRNWPRRRSGPKSGARLWTSAKVRIGARRVTACSLSCSPARRHTPAGSRRVLYGGTGWDCRRRSVQSRPTQSKAYAIPPRVRTLRLVECSRRQGAREVLTDSHWAAL